MKKSPVDCCVSLSDDVAFTDWTHHHAATFITGWMIWRRLPWINRSRLNWNCRVCKTTLLMNTNRIGTFRKLKCESNPFCQSNLKNAVRNRRISAVAGRWSIFSFWNGLFQSNALAHFDTGTFRLWEKKYFKGKFSWHIDFKSNAKELETKTNETRTPVASRSFQLFWSLELFPKQSQLLVWIFRLVGRCEAGPAIDKDEAVTSRASISSQPHYASIYFHFFH